MKSRHGWRSLYSQGAPTTKENPSMKSTWHVTSKEWKIYIQITCNVCLNINKELVSADMTLFLCSIDFSCFDFHLFLLPPSERRLQFFLFSGGHKYRYHSCTGPIKMSHDKYRVRDSSGSGGGGISHKKMASQGGHIDFMFLGSPLYPAAGSATERWSRNRCYQCLPWIVVLRESARTAYCGRK